MSKMTTIAIITFALLTTYYKPAQATIYFYYDAENQNVGTSVPRLSTGINMCTLGCNSYGYADAVVQNWGEAVQGKNYFQWTTVDNQPSAYTEIKDSSKLPINVSLGTTYYLAYHMRFHRINGKDIWRTGFVQSADKLIEIDSPTQPCIRWAVSPGQWTTYSSNQPHKFTIWLGNPSNHLNPTLEHGDVYWQNQNGYSNTNPIQLQYERWYSVIMAIKMASDNTGAVALYVNGVKVLEYIGYPTVATGCTPRISMIEMNGSFAQGAYDAPAHYRQFDALMLTDNWQDVLDGGYMKAPLSPPTP